VINGWLVEMGLGELPELGVLFDPSLKGLSAEALYDRIVAAMNSRAPTAGAAPRRFVAAPRRGRSAASHPHWHPGELQADLFTVPSFCGDGFPC
jgi:hypothetical protein